MPEREKVIKGLESCSGVDCTEGQYCTEGHGHNDCIERLCSDTLALVKEQEQAMKEKDGTISNLIAQIKEISQCYERVVRCKDCKHGRMINILNYTCTESQNHCEHILHSPDWFCADGRKKDD